MAAIPERDDRRQVEFPPMQTHVKSFEYAHDRVLDPVRGDRARDRAGDGHRQYGAVGVSTHGHAAESRPSVSARGFLRPRVLAFVGLLVLIVLAANSCQNSQVRFNQQQAIALARQQVDFQPTHTQVRLVRQGIQSQPIWAVSLSVPTGPDQFDRWRSCGSTPTKARSCRWRPSGRRRPPPLRMRRGVKR